MHYFLLAQPTPTAFCAAEEGEPLRGVTTSAGRDFLIGAVSHRGADCALVVDLPLTRAQIEAGLSASWRRAFPGWQPTDETLAGVRSLLDLAAAHPWGTVLRAVDGCAELTPPTTTTVSRAARLLPVTLAMLRALTPAAAPPQPAAPPRWMH